MKKVAIHQPNFIPWTGYFNKIKETDLFVFLDDVQFERGKTFTSRSKILQNGQELWLTIPVLNKSSLYKINQIQVDDSFIWKKKHLKTLYISYKKAPYFDEIYSLIEKGYKINSNLLVDYNLLFINLISDYLELKTKFINSSSLLIDNHMSGWEKLMEILLKVQATDYFSGSGSGSKRYVKEEDLNKVGINLEWQQFSLQPYKQINNNLFRGNLSILDALFMNGKKTMNLI